MSRTCKDCGCRIYNGVCSNCHEELYIIENQAEFIDRPLSKEFTDKAAQSALKLRDNS